jgi:hypothetical protein
MVRVNLTRQSYEAISADSGESLSISRQNAEVLGNQDSAVAERVNLTRMSYEMIFETPAKVSVIRQNAEVMSQFDQLVAERMNLSRMSYETICALIKKVSIIRQNAEVMGQQDAAVAERVNITRMSYEVLSRKGPNPVVPLPLAANIDLFMHNWTDEATLENSWLTDVQQGGADGAEERRGLSLKPTRTVNLQWTMEGIDECDRLLLALRKVSKGTFQVPLYPDQIELAVGASSGTRVLTFDPTQRRFFAGGRVAIVRRSSGMVPIISQISQVFTQTTSSLTLTDDLTFNVIPGDIIVPMIDVEAVLTPSIHFDMSYGGSVKMTVVEVSGASQLPAHDSDNPVGFDSYRNKPIFDINPNWIQGFDMGFDHQGERYTAGRAANTYLVGDRSRLVTNFFFMFDRNDAWDIVQFFDTRRGRLRSFWMVDQDQLWLPVSTSGTTFLDVDPLGDFDMFVEDMDYVGIVLKDGTTIIREVVTIEETLGIWRITPIEDFPVFDPNDVVRVARARIVRFDADAMQESWANDNVMTTRLGFIECLNEMDVEL